MQRARCSACLFLRLFQGLYYSCREKKQTVARPQKSDAVIFGRMFFGVFFVKFFQSFVQGLTQGDV